MLRSTEQQTVGVQTSRDLLTHGDAGQFIEIDQQISAENKVKSCQIRNVLKHVHSTDIYHFSHASRDHGLASALLGVSVCNVLKSRAVAGADLAQPAQLLAALNRNFKLEEQEGRTFTMWYGVIEHATRRLTWSGGGHPSALLFRGSAGAPIELESQNPGVGMIELDEFEQQEIVVPPDSRLLLFSDGAFEIHKQDGGMWTFREFMQFVSQPDEADDCILDRLIRYVRTLKGSAVLDDDFSIMDLKVGFSNLTRIIHVGRTKFA